MKRLLTISGTILFLACTAITFKAQQGPIHGCLQKNSGVPRIVQSAGECKQSELAVSWGRGNSFNSAKKIGSKTITALQTLGGTENFAHAINDRGEIVGTSRVAGDTATHAFLYRQGQVFDLSPLDSGIIQTGATGINNHGQIVSGFVVGGVYVPAIYNSLAQTLTTLGSLGGQTSSGFSGVATAINNGGTAVGYAYLNASNRHAFVFRDGVLSDIGSFGGYSGARDINDPGAIVGFASNTVNGVAHAFVYRDGTMTDIDPFGGGSFLTSESYANSINNGGDIVGQGLLQTGGFHAFLNRKGSVTDLGTLPGGRNSFATGINESGVIVGQSDVPFLDQCFDFSTGQFVPCINFRSAAFVYANGVMTELNTLIPGDSGWELIYASDINNKGQIVGYGLLGGKFRAFLLQ